MKILNFGSLNIDFVYEVDHAVKSGDTFTRYFIGTITENRNI